MDEYLSKAVHEEFCRRQDDENARQNRRIELLEENVEKIGALATSVEKLALNMEGMLKEQEKQSKRLEALEQRDGKMWRKATGYILTAVLGIIVGFVFKQLGM